MTLHPQLSEILASLHAAGFGDTQNLALDALRAAAREAYVPLGPAVRSRELRIASPGGELSLQIYEPPQSPGLNSGLLFFSAGSYVVGEQLGHTALCQQLAISAGCVVVTTQLRLAPEQPFPAAILDAYAVTCWVHENAEDLGIDHVRLAIGGESTGAALATAVCRLAKERRNPPLAFQLLLYPVVDLRASALSQLTAANDQVLLIDRALVERLAGWYAQSEAERADPRCSPLAASNLIGVPPALIISAEHDVLREQIAAYAAALRAAHVPVTLSEYAGMAHGFVHLFALLDGGRDALVECSAALRTAFQNVLAAQA